MTDENDKKLEEKELIKETLDNLANALCFVYETESNEGHALAFMVDSALKYGQVILRGHNVLSASADYTTYEQEVFEAKQKESSETIE